MAGDRCRRPARGFRRRAERELPRAEIVRARGGALAAMDIIPHQTRSVAGLVPLEIVNGDGRRHDVLVALPSGREGRPVVWMWQDVRTRRILAWRTGEELPGLLQLLEINYSPTVVDTDAGGRGKGRGRAKPIERAFGDLARQIDTHPALAGAYTGRSTTDRPETHRMRAAPWDDFVDVVARCVAEHNARPGRRTEAAAGRSFDQAWADEIGHTVVRRLSPSQAAILLLAAEDVLVDRSGCVRLKAGRGSGLPANRYHSPDLVERAGTRVVARFDPAALHAGVRIFDLQGRHICHADCLMPVGFADGAKAGEYQRNFMPVQIMNIGCNPLN